MKRHPKPPRIVIDTNLVLSALVFVHGRLTPLRAAWQAGHVQPLASRATVAELMRVLAYPKFKLTPGEQQELLADYLPCCETVLIPDPPPLTPKCRDAFDLPFLQLALAGKADALVSGDGDLLALAGEFACPIMTAEQFLQGLKNLEAWQIGEIRQALQEADAGDFASNEEMTTLKGKYAG